MNYFSNCIITVGTAKPKGKISEALKRKDETRQVRSANRRRVRGGAPLVVAPNKPAFVDPKLESRDDADEIAALCVRMLVSVHSSLGLNSVS
jgi:DNA excision repair protein ERCC-4